MTEIPEMCMVQHLGHTVEIVVMSNAPIGLEDCELLSNHAQYSLNWVLGLQIIDQYR